MSVEDPSIRAGPDRARRPTLTRHAVVGAAITIADADGLPAVSIRRVAAELGVRTMSLYTHIHSKDDLLNLMRERCAAEMIIAGDLPSDWRAAIHLIAARQRQVARRHPWLIHLINPAGPNALRHLEQSLQALTRLTADPQAALAAAVAIDHYVIGHVLAEVTGQPTTASTHPYTRALLDSGTFPTLGPLLAAGLPHDTFEQGLTWLLDGIESAHRPQPGLPSNP